MNRFRASGVGAALRDVARGACVSILSISLGILTACGGSDEPSAPPPVATTIQVSPATLSLEVAQTQQLSATVLDQNGRPMTGQALVWSSSDTTRLTVDAVGVARGVRPGTASAEARSGAVTGTAAANISAPALRFVSRSCASPFTASPAPASRARVPA